MAAEIKFDLRTVLDGLGQGVMVFGKDGRLVMENLAARTFLGTDLNLIRAKGWDAASTLFNTKQTNPDETIEAIRDKTLQSSRPMRFHIFRSGEYIPCWAAAVLTESGEVCTMITIDTMDWSAMTNLMDRFRDEMQEAIDSTQGHVDLIGQTIKHAKPDMGVELLGRRVGGFTRLISVHMHRVGRLMHMLERLENIRTGKMRDIVQERRRKITLVSYFEDFAEQLDEIMLVDPETEAQDHRSRLSVDVPKDLAVAASSVYLTRILHDLLRNAIMYSMKATPVKIVARAKGQNVQIDMIDEGYGIREKEHERVFDAFQRARQPQIVAEFGYGLSLYLCKNEVEAMNGRMWFQSEEGVGTTFSFMLPLWREEAPKPEAQPSNVSSSDSATV